MPVAVRLEWCMPSLSDTESDYWFSVLGSIPNEVANLIGTGLYLELGDVVAGHVPPDKT